MFVPIRVITRSFVVFQFLLCVFVGSNVAIAEPKVDYGINVKKAHQDFLAMPEAKKKKITQDFSRLLNSSGTVMRSNHFHGIQTWQNPFDVWVTQEIIFEVKPDLILETGTFRGGSSLMWAMYLEQVSPDGRVITIDIEDKRVPRSKTHPLAAKVDFLLGSSTASDIVADVKRRAKGKRVLIILDSLHTKDHVADELANYADLVPVGGYIIIQDTPVGAIEAIHEFVAANDAFEIDKSRERLLYTFNLDGFLKRVK
ncbi:MAG: cephalosporin hydroxylase [Myxococcota bacterium]|jgi:cephalosporin hydroxylase